MQPMTFTVDTQRVRNKLIQWTQNTVLGMIFALMGPMVGDFGLMAGLATTWPWTLPGLAFAVYSAVMVVRFSRYLNAAGHQVSVGVQGLAVVQHGRRSQWRWPEISQLRLQGRFATFTTGPSDDRTMRIDDIYMTPLAQVVTHINECRDQAADAGSPSPHPHADETAPMPPTVFGIDARTQRRRQGFEIVALLVVVAAIPLMALALGPEKAGRILDILLDAAPEFLAIGVCLIAFTSGISVLATRKFSNFLQITEEGLTWSRRLTAIRQWRWQDLSSFEIRDRRAGGPGGARTIAFTAADDGRPFKDMGLSTLFLTRSASAAPTSFAIDDTYEADLGRIAARLNSARARALAAFPPARTIEHPATMPEGPAGQPVNFQQDVQEVRKMGVVVWTLGFGGFIWLPVVLLLGWPFDIPGGMVGWAKSPEQWLLRFVSFLPLILIIAELLILMREIVPADNMISLDRAGLALTRGGRKKLWTWRDVSDFQVEVRKVLGLFGHRGIIVFGAPGGRDLRSRFLRLCYRLTGRAPAMVIEDVYDTPLADIAVTLNRYRAENAVGGPGAVPAE